jgi:hypothetical protein
MSDPIELTDELSQFLVELRDSGRINMLAAAPEIQAEFGCSGSEAQEVLMLWIHSF